jgi:polyisoprenyl-teichoic acid--peptidoglycan teichoic acid transferase
MLHSAPSVIDEARDRPATRPHRPWVAAALSFLFPGLGQAYAGRLISAAVFALPVLALITVGLAFATGLAGDRNSLLSARFLVAVFVVNGALLLWRAAAIAHAGLAPLHAPFRPRRFAVASVAALIVVSIAMHVWVGVVVASLESTLSQVFAGDAPTRDEAVPTPRDSGSTPAPRPDATPIGSRWDGIDRINVLLVGTDAAPGRLAALTDVILVVSVDPADESAVVISVPRDTGWVPLPDDTLFPNGLYPGKVNEIAARAALDPDTWCPGADLDPAGCGIRALERTVGLYLGIEIHHYALVDMAGFADIIDAVGGVQLCMPGRLVDPTFDGSLEGGTAGEPLILPRGCHRYDGLDALAFARSRKGWIEMPDGTVEPQNDFARNELQQQLLLALRRELADADTLFELPGLLSAIGRTVSTDVPREQAGDLAALAPVIAGPDIERVVLGYPDFVELPPDPDVDYTLIPRREAIRAEMRRIFGRNELVGWYLATRDSTPSTERSRDSFSP